MTETAIEIQGLTKGFVRHAAHERRLPVLGGFDLSVAPGECVALAGPSGVGKSTVLRCLYGSYRPQAGSIRVAHEGALVELVGAEPWLFRALRRRTIGYVSQFLRLIPRVPALRVVAEPMIDRGLDEAEAERRAGAMLEQLNIPSRLWDLPPATFSGGEQQRVNLARALAPDYPILLLDEPTAALDADNRAVVVELTRAARTRGAALVGIFHDRPVRDAVADRILELVPSEAAA
ncbi:alpha-D-ribose 1-methylphosphonate 5-triphosphate synthase subunit PhnL [Tistlia consotensis]|uniref:Alpha-D-ribose 1-methylphosphonate 5-triphosphate synthase subunit PhnL n=1 Tax=Tistlia consotensis USBA 355 TaxID=560819 RepID=A0A1Y6CQ06_9PROT|nr:phosphonate C-P lyase system protein PhnL [Tistlia consotensis]SMF80470.1 alpha-D-ribose 1-methylphosphonate 5-triphosphate synthase subunit PhnL [Tistlia consotensis USBA 355]SNR62765.1 alpha-D-ribose 1-methylphosphonate 5-triphosphate synthase subunit PhnL [Tistlia consotensis]